MIPVVCPCTGVKRFANIYGQFLNVHPIWGIAILCLVALFTLFGLATAAILLVGAVT